MYDIVRVCFFAVTALFATTIGFAAPAGAQETALMVSDIGFVSHVTAGMVEQDAYCTSSEIFGQYGF